MKHFLLLFVVTLVDLHLSEAQDADTTKPIRINAGSKVAVTDEHGIVWSAERGFTGGGIVTRTTRPPGLAEIYSTEHFGDFIFSESLPNGKYKVTLHLCESYHPSVEAAKGKRNFSIQVEDAKDQIVDLSAEARGIWKPLLKTYEVDVKDDKLDITFTATPLSRADYDPGCINAIEIESVK